MRINWGLFIFVLYAAFVGFMGFLVYKTFGPKVDLVSTDYYEKELAFQGQIDATKAAQAFSVPVTCKAENGQLTIVFPAEMQGKTFLGTLHFYCPWNAENDKTIPFSNAAQSEIKVTMPTLPAGKYKLNMDWVAEGKKYHVEESLFL